MKPLFRWFHRLKFGTGFQLRSAKYQQLHLIYNYTACVLECTWLRSQSFLSSKFQLRRCVVNFDENLEEPSTNAFNREQHNLGSGTVFLIVKERNQRFLIDGMCPLCFQFFIVSTSCILFLFPPYKYIPYLHIWNALLQLVTLLFNCTHFVH